VRDAGQELLPGELGIDRLVVSVGGPVLREMQCEQVRPFAFTEPGGRLPAFFRMLGNNTGRTWPMSAEACSATWGFSWTISKHTSPDCGNPIEQKNDRNRG